MARPEPVKQPLRGTGILVTRPTQQRDGLCRSIEHQGGHAIRLATLEILPSEHPAAAAALLGSLDDVDLLLFTSPNAVSHALPWLPELLPSGLLVGAVGEATAARLDGFQLPVHVLPDGRFDSEGLLARPELQQVAGKRVIIVRGNGGRPTLGENLRERGAEVEYAEVYRRRCPEVDAGELIRHWAENVHYVTATSNELLDNLFHICGEAGRPLLQDTPLVVVSERMREHARELGVRDILLADNAGDDAIVACIAQRLQDNSPA